MRLVENYIGGLLNYANFGGRASRSEYWWFAGANLTLATIFWSLGKLGSPLGSLSLLYAIALLLPNLSITVRRLHDVNKSGWNMLWALTIIGVFYVLYLEIIKGSEVDNDYGAPSNA